MLAEPWSCRVERFWRGTQTAPLPVDGEPRSPDAAGQAMPYSGSPRIVRSGGTPSGRVEVERPRQGPLVPVPSLDRRRRAGLARAGPVVVAHEEDPVGAGHARRERDRRALLAGGRRDRDGCGRIGGPERRPEPPDEPAVGRDVDVVDLLDVDRRSRRPRGPSGARPARRSPCPGSPRSRTAWRSSPGRSSCRSGPPAGGDRGRP